MSWLEQKLLIPKSLYHDKISIHAWSSRFQLCCVSLSSIDFWPWSFLHCEASSWNGEECNFFGIFSRLLFDSTFLSPFSNLCSRLLSRIEFFDCVCLIVGIPTHSGAFFALKKWCGNSRLQVFIHDSRQLFSHIHYLVAEFSPCQLVVFISNKLKICKCEWKFSGCRSKSQERKRVWLKKKKLSHRSN